MAIAKLYKEANYGGQELYVDADIASFGQKDFNDKLTSVKVISGTFTLYQDANYAGINVTVCSKGGPKNDGQYPNSSYLGGHNDCFSSIRINSDEPKSA